MIIIRTTTKLQKINNGQGVEKLKSLYIGQFYKNHKKLQKITSIDNGIEKLEPFVLLVKNVKLSSYGKQY